MQHTPFLKTKRNANISFLLGLLTAAFCASPAQALQFNFSDVTGNLTDGDADGVGATMRYNDVASENGTTYDLLITTLDSYQVANTSFNGSINGNDGSINMLNNTSTTFRFSVVEADTNNLVKASSIEFGIFDLDGPPNGQERISLNTPASYTVTEDPASALAIETSRGNRVQFTAPPGEIPNPTNSQLLTQEQEQHSVNFVFNNTSEFDLGFEVIDGTVTSGRNIFFAGDLVFDDSITSTTTFAKVPFEISPGWGLLLSVGTLFGFNYLKKRSSLNSEVELR